MTFNGRFVRGIRGIKHFGARKLINIEVALHRVIPYVAYDCSFLRSVGNERKRKRL